MKPTLSSETSAFILRTPGKFPKEHRLQVQLGAPFYLICLFLFYSCFGHPCVHHQKKIAVSMGHWYLSLSMVGVRSAGWISIQSADRKLPIQSDKYQCRIDTILFSWWWAHRGPKHVQKRNKYINTLRTGLLNCLNARSRGLNFRHRASSI